MEPVEVKAGEAKTETASLQERVTFHKSEIRRHRRELSNCMAALERVKQIQAEDLGFEVVVQQAHSQEAKSNGSIRT